MQVTLRFFWFVVLFLDMNLLVALGVARSGEPWTVPWALVSFNLIMLAVVAFGKFLKYLWPARAVIVLAILLVAGSAGATCLPTYVCDDYGRHCKTVDFCDNTYDLPSYGMGPIPTLPSYEMKPLAPLTIPPPGTTQCDYVMADGRWQYVCWR